MPKQATETQHTPTPWRYADGAIFTADDASVRIAEIDRENADNHATVDADGRLIVTAVNAHADLVAALRRLADAVDVGGTARGRWTAEEGRAMEQARAALAKVQP